MQESVISLGLRTEPGSLDLKHLTDQDHPPVRLAVVLGDGSDEKRSGIGVLAVILAARLVEPENVRENWAVCVVPK